MLREFVWAVFVQVHLQVFNQNSFSRFGNTTCGRADRYSCFFFYLDFICGERKSRQPQLNTGNFYLMSHCTSSSVAIVRYTLWTKVCDLRPTCTLFWDSTLRKISRQRRSHLYRGASLKSRKICDLILWPWNWTFK